jgi:dCMP deaminase
MTFDQKVLKDVDTVALASPDPSSKMGCIILHGVGKHEVGRGYNSFPEQCVCDKSYYDNRPLKYDRVIHAEMRAIISAGRLACIGGSLYTGCPPCKECAKHLAEARIARVYFWRSRLQHSFVQRFPDNIATAMTIFAENDVKVVEIPDL